MHHLVESSSRHQATRERILESQALASVNANKKKIQSEKSDTIQEYQMSMKSIDTKPTIHTRSMHAKHGQSGCKAQDQHSLPHSKQTRNESRIKRFWRENKKTSVVRKHPQCFRTCSLKTVAVSKARCAWSPLVFETNTRPT